MSQDAPNPVTAPAKFNPWLFVPLLYFMQAIPVTIVQEVAAIFYKDMGVEPGPILQWTSLIGLPWSMQLLLGPLVDLNFTKRKWILGGQFLIAIGLGATAFLLNLPHAFEITLVILGATAITSALCNIATDGFYLLSMSKEQQAEFVGVQTTSYRLGRLFCTGLLVLFVGLMTRFAPLPVNVQGGSMVFKDKQQFVLRTDAQLKVSEGLITDENGLPLQPEIKTPGGMFGLTVGNDGSLTASTVLGQKPLGLISLATEDTSGGSQMPAVVPANSVQARLAGGSSQAPVNPILAWTLILAGCAVIYFLGHLANRFTVPRPAEDQPQDEQSPVETRRNISRTLLLVAVGLSGYFFLSSIVNLVAYSIWKAKDGTLPTFDPAGKITGPVTGLQGWALPPHGKFIGFDLGLTGIGAEVFQLLVCGFLLALSLFAARQSLKGTAMAEALGTYVRQSGFPAIFGFILFYRLGEAMVGKMSPLFLKASLVEGGLAIPNDQLGLIKGLAGVIGIIVGGLTGGWVVSKIGLRRAFWPLALAMHIPNLLYVWASTPNMHPPLWSLYIVDFVDQFGYGFGFAAYMVYIMWVAQRGHFKTTHYAIGTGMGALCIAFAGIISGIIQANFGYHWFFISVIFLTIPGMLTLLFIPLDESHRQAKAA